MSSYWRTDGCYAEHGVDGSRCSFLKYLSTVENWCPPSAPVDNLVEDVGNIVEQPKENVSEWVSAELIMTCFVW